MFVHEFHRFARLCFTLLGSFCVTTTPAHSAFTNPPPSQPIPWNQLRAQTTAQYSGDGLAVNATAEGARLRCVFQKLEAEVTAAGLWLRSTATGAADRTRVVAARLRRDAGPTILLERRGRVDLATGHARYRRPRLIEEYSASVGYEYHVQRTDSLTPPMTWTTLTMTPLSPADDGSLTFTDTNAPAGTAYYRVVQH